MYISHYVSVGLDPDINPDEEEEKRRLITQVLELQNTLDGKFVNYFLNLFDTHFYFQYWNHNSILYCSSIQWRT